MEERGRGPERCKLAFRGTCCRIIDYSTRLETQRIIWDVLALSKLLMPHAVLSRHLPGRTASGKETPESRRSPKQIRQSEGDANAL